MKTVFFSFFALLGFIGASANPQQRIFRVNSDVLTDRRPLLFMNQVDGPPVPPSNQIEYDDYRPLHPQTFMREPLLKQGGPPASPQRDETRPPPRHQGKPPSPHYGQPPTPERDGPPPPPAHHGGPPQPPLNDDRQASPRPFGTDDLQFITVPLEDVRVISQNDVPNFVAAVEQLQPHAVSLRQRLLVVRKLDGSNNQLDSPRPSNGGPFLYINGANFVNNQQQDAPSSVVHDAAIYNDAMVGKVVLRKNYTPLNAAEVSSNYYLNVKHQFDRVDPRNPESEWRWSSLGGYVADRGTFVRDALSSVDLSSIPFSNSSREQNFVASDGNARLAALTNHEALLVSKRNIQLAPNQQVTARFSFTCKVFNEKQQPYPSNVVSNAEDDPTLANCGISVATLGDTSLVFSIVATNKGVWAVYERNRYMLATDSDSQNRVFTIFHRLANRKSPEEIIDAAITLDRSQNRVDFALKGQQVWNITQLGTLPSNEPSTQQHSSPYQRPDLQKVVDPSEVRVTFGLGKYMDEYDPNNPSPNGLRKQRLVKQSNYYDPNAKFYDDDAKPENNSFGQGATMTLYDAVIQVKNAS